jgi:hypothetical protein
MRKLLLQLAFFACCPVLLGQQTLNNDAVLKLVKAGLSDDLIVTTINASPGTYDISANGLIFLKQGGADDKVIAAIVTKSSSAPAGPPAAAPAPPASGSTPDSTPEPSEPGVATGSGTISPGARVVIAPMGGFETYFAAAVREKKVPVTLTLDRTSAQFYVVSANTEWQGFVYASGGSASWNANGGSTAHGAAASSTRGLEASIMLINAKTKDVVWAYEVHKSSHGALLLGTLGARGQQSIAEACAKHLKEYIEKGK